ncbi:MAG: hypothetical protein LUQ59_04625 [Methanothrix sp.]|nr:hypothetical protein [Methanothrix sp.]
MTDYAKATNIICAYPVNLDAVCNIRGEDVSRLIPLSLSFEKIVLRKTIASREDLITSLLFCMREGSGAELLIESLIAAKEIEEAFSWQYRLGGNAGIMANALASLGGRPLLNAPALGNKLSKMLHAQVAVPLSGGLAYPGDAEKAGSSAAFADDDLVHFVFQFKEGDAVFTQHIKITARSNDRFIATCDPVNTRLFSDEHFGSYCLENIRDFGGALLSGFHLVPLLEHRQVFSEKISQIKSWKDRNPDLFIHMELGSFQSPQIIQSLLHMIMQIPVDSLGMNEDELAAIAASSQQLSPDQALSGCRQSWREIMQAAESLQDRLGIFRVAAHTRDCILSVMRNDRISAKSELLALESGVNAAAALAATGSLKGTPPQEINENGLRSVREFCQTGAIPERRGAILQSEDRIVSMTPSLVAREPRITVGLGDTATAAIFLYEICGLLEK